MRPFSSAGRSDTTSARNALAIIAPDYVDVRAISAGSSEVHPIPAWARVVVFSATSDFFAKFGTAAVATAVPIADITNGSAPELNPAARHIPEGATHIAVAAAAACTVTMSFYEA